MDAPVKAVVSIFLTTMLVLGCASSRVGPKSELLSGVSLGMSKSQVVSVMGTPSRVSANEEAEYLIYLLVDDYDATTTVASMGLFDPSTDKSEYFVKIVGGKVVSYGQVGEFGENIK